MSPRDTAPVFANAPASDRRLWLGFAAATTGTLMINLDATVVNVIMPQLQRDFGLPLSTLQWAVTSYLLVITGLLPLGEQLTGYVGRRRMLVLGFAAFTLGSAVAGLSVNFATLVAARMLQGIGGAIIQVNVMAIVALTFPPSRRGQALGMIGSVVAAGALAGPTLGGVLTQFFDWRSVFWVNLPIGVVGMWAVHRYLPDFPRDRETALRTMDWGGAALFFAATAALQFGLSEPMAVTGLLALAAAALVVGALVWVELRHPRPLIKLSLFRITSFWRNQASGLAFNLVMVFPSFLLPFYLQVVLHEPMWIVGVSLLPQAAMTFVWSPIGGRIADRRGVLLPARIGFLLFVVADLALAVPERVPLAAVWVVTALTGMASGLVMAPNNSAILSAVPPRDTGIASAIIATQRNLGRNIGTALAVLLPSAYWMAVGAGATPSVAATGYPSLFESAFRVTFLVAPVFALIGMALLRAPGTDPEPAPDPAPARPSNDATPSLDDGRRPVTRS